MSMKDKQRLVYDALDVGDYKKVLTITSKPKEMEKNPLLKVLRAIALQRSDKQDEALVT